MSDDDTPRRILDDLRDDLDAALNGRPLPARPDNPHDAGVHLAVALRIHAGIQGFRINWSSAVAADLATVTVPDHVAAWFFALGTTAQPLPAEAGHTSFLMTEAECHDLADRIEADLAAPREPAPRARLRRRRHGPGRRYSR